MLTPPRFVVLDDKPDHLTPIIEAFTSIGTSCIGVPYDDENNNHLTTDYYRGVRGLFIDLNLSGGSLGKNQHYGVIVNILETVITKNNGPFVLVLWTENPQELPDLKTYLEESIQEGYEYCKPLSLSALSKTKYINTSKGHPDFGKILPGKETEFKQVIKDFFTDTPQIATLFDWESKVLEAVNQTLIELITLIPKEKRTFNNYADEIDKVLSCITGATLGNGHVEKDPRQAFNVTIAPILIDKILNNKNTYEDNKTWENAITKVNSDDSKIKDTQSIGRYNKMLHLAVTDHENMTPLDWGSVLTPIYWGNEMTCDLFGMTTSKIKSDVFGLKETFSSSYEPVFVRLGAVCDYAQQKEGLIPYYLGYKISLDDYKKNKRNNDFEWKSPLFFTDKDSAPFYLIFNLKYLISLPKHKTFIFEAKYRIREQLLNQLIIKASNHASRPGITELFPPK